MDAHPGPPLSEHPSAVGGARDSHHVDEGVEHQLARGARIAHHRLGADRVRRPHRQLSRGDSRNDGRRAVGLLRGHRQLADAHQGSRLPRRRPGETLEQLLRRARRFSLGEPLVAELTRRAAGHLGGQPRGSGIDLAPQRRELALTFQQLRIGESAEPQSAASAEHAGPQEPRTGSRT